MKLLFVIGAVLWLLGIFMIKGLRNDGYKFNPRMPWRPMEWTASVVQLVGILCVVAAAIWWAVV
jgi:hypothetical protein